MSALETARVELADAILGLDPAVVGPWRFSPASPGTYGYDSVLIEDGRKVAGVIAKWPAGAAEYIAAASPVNVTLLLAEVTRLRGRVDELLAANNREVERRRALMRAGRDLYFAGRWSCDRPADEGALWIALRDALELEPGSATKAGVANAQLSSLPVCWAWFRAGAMAQRDAIVERIHGTQGELFALTAADVPLATPPALETPRPSSAGTWGWYAGSNSEWYEVGPYESREVAIAQARAHFGADFAFHIVEAQTGAVHMTAESVILNFLEGEAGDLFDAEHQEADRAGSGTEIEAADLELQARLDEWLDRWRHTFAKPNIFAATRNEEVIAAQPETAA